MDEMISVIVPAYNVGDYLGNCLESLLAQTYNNLEIIVVNDGSKDNTKVVIDNYQEKHPTVIRGIHTDNQGVTLARLTGFREAKGNWIAFVDGDDEVQPEMFERLLKNAVENHADISHCGHRTIVNNGERFHDFYNTGRFEIKNREDGLEELLFGSYEPSIWNKLYKYELVQSLDKNDLMDTSIRYNEDLLMNYYLFNMANVTVFEDFCGYYYMARSSSVTRNAFQSQKILDPMKVRKIILDQIDSEMKDKMWGEYLFIAELAYSSLYGKPEESENVIMIRDILVNNRSKWKFMRKSDRIKLRALLFSPQIYNKVYYLLKKHLQKKKYE